MRFKSLNQSIIAIFLVIAAIVGLSVLAKADSVRKEINLGSSSIEGNIRYPSFQVIENSETLKKATQEVLSREFSRIEEEIVNSPEVEDEPH